ncbi:DUF7351 domain-containing protein [Haloarchaeobius litoreus]|uniref:Helix-turn-helix domain-containing protein n=1 Tax=Haloarchaeobius litoreus TaxID=755306 RepID=A0ABD6DGF8_9EURY|nr:hypothetical protein [Haloarchaeobius litoreus]
MGESDESDPGDRPVPPDEPAPPADAFERLGHEIRLATIEALAEQRRESWLPHGLRFSELREAVGVRDTGQFNYHLDQLRGSFVSQFGDEYVLTNAGFELAGALRAGTFDQTAGQVERRAELDHTCPICADSLDAVYEHGYLRVLCPDHGRILTTTLPPAAVRGRELSTVVDLANARTRDQVQRVRAGACPHCWGRSTVTAPAVPSEEYLRTVVGDDDDCADAADYEHNPDEDAVLAECSCEDCGMRFWLPVSVCVAHHPAVVAYYHDHGVEMDASYLDMPHATGSNGTVVSENPVRIEVEVVVDDADERLVLTLDAATEVVDQRLAPTG